MYVFKKLYWCFPEQVSCWKQFPFVGTEAITKSSADFGKWNRKPAFSWTKELKRVCSDKNKLKLTHCTWLKQKFVLVVKMQALQVLALLLLSGVFGKDLQECEDLGNGSHLCREIESFEQLNRYVGKNWQSVKVVNEHTGIERAEDGELPGLSTLLQLDLSESGGVTLGEKGLQDFKALQKLNLTHAQLDELKSEQFPNPSDMINFDVSYNDILAITTKLMSGFANLEYANFSENLIAVIEPNAFKHMKNLRFLDLTTNYQENITLGENANLRFLSISNNNLRDVSDYEFS